MTLGRTGLPLSDPVIIMNNLKKGVIDSQSLPKGIDIKFYYEYPPWPKIQESTNPAQHAIRLFFNGFVRDVLFLLKI